jgi:lipoyl(octanoyl) transferase
LLRSDLTLKSGTVDEIRWETADGFVPYQTALERMDAESDAIQRGDRKELVWLLEHSPLYTAGTSAKDDDLRDARFPVHVTGRGGQHTYHGPGQRIAYTMLDLRKRGNDVRAFVAGLESWIIGTLADFGVVGERREDRVGVWVKTPTGEDKIAALGIRVRRGVSLHGISLNVDPDLSHYDGIVPCGISEFGVTSLHQLGVKASMQDVDQALRRNFERVLGKPTTA